MVTPVIVKVILPALLLNIVTKSPATKLVDELIVTLVVVLINLPASAATIVAFTVDGNLA